MNDKEFKAQQKRIMKFSDFWRTELGLNYWRITYLWSREAIPDHQQAAGVCDADWHYQRADISFNLRLLKDMDDEEADKVVLHEHAHCLVNEMRDFNGRNDLKHEERVVSALTAAFGWVRSAARKEGEQAAKKVKA